MAKLERKNFKVFAENAPLDEMGQFGSAVATTKKNTKDIEEIQELEAWQQGWGGAVISNKNYPPMEEMNGALNVMSYQTAYTLQEGIPEWNKDTVYYIGSIVKTLIDNKVVLYQSLKNDNIGNVLDNSEYWERLSLGGGGLEICDIGMALYVDETKGLRRYLNGQVVDINANTQAFLNRLKEIQTTNPDYFTTEDNWQAEATLNIDGCVYKFVLNYASDGETVVSVRLPKYPDYVEINAGGTLPVVGNGMSLGLSNGKDNLSVTGYSGSNQCYMGYDGYGKTIGTTLNPQALTTGFLATGVTTDPTKSGLETTLKQTKLKLRYFIQIATGSETENNIVNSIELNNPYSLFDSKYSDHELNNLSWLKSEGQWNAKSVYTDAYDKLLKVYNGTETVEGLSVKLSTETYTDYDFVLNTSDETFRLPLKTKLASGKAVVGNGMTLGLTNGTQNGGLYLDNLNGSYLFTSLLDAYGKNVGSTSTAAGLTPNKTIGITTDPTKSGVELSDSGLYLYYYVGETVQNANLIDAGRIGEQMLTRGNKEEIISWGMPDYSSGVTYTLGTNLNATVDGFIIGNLRNSNVNSNVTVTIQVNGTTIVSTLGTTAGGFSMPIFIPITKGNTYKISSTAGADSLTNLIFYPCKGVN